MRKIQKTSMYSMSSGNEGRGLSAITKTYNSDIRKLRDNEDSMYELEKLMRLAENEMVIGEEVE